MTEEELINYLKVIADKDRHSFQRAEAIDVVLKEFRDLLKLANKDSQQ